jgi:hypothetical protein
MDLVDTLAHAGDVLPWLIAAGIALPALVIAGFFATKLAERAAFLRLADELGLEASGSSLFGFRRLDGKVGGVRVRVREDSVAWTRHGRGRSRRRVVDVIADGAPSDVDVAPDGLLQRWMLTPDAEVGDAEFDRRVRLDGHDERVRELFASPEARRATLRLVGLGGRIEDGRVVVRCHMILPGWAGVREAVDVVVETVEALAPSPRFGLGG